MSRNGRQKRNNFIWLTLSVFVLLIIVIAVQTGILQDTDEAAQTHGPSGRLTIHYLDVGQADCILVQQGTHSMLIDTGNNADAAAVTGYLDKQGVKKLDFLVLTHPHEDHIGSADAIIRKYGIGKLYMPRAAANTKTYRDVIGAMTSKGLKASAPVPGTGFMLGDAGCTILAPNSSSYEDLNNYSIVLRIRYGYNTFMFDGDAETLSEKEILERGYDVKADVLKIGHHGSGNSTSEAFLEAVAPKYAVISVGEKNDYRHPHRVTMDKLEEAGITVYRTDECGTVVCTSDGTHISFNTKPGDYRYNDG